MVLPPTPSPLPMDVDLGDVIVPSVSGFSSGSSESDNAASSSDDEEVSNDEEEDEEDDGATTLNQHDIVPIGSGGQFNVCGSDLLPR